MNDSSAKPTRKLIAAALTTVVLYVISRFTEVDKDTEQLVNVLAPLVVAYVYPNQQNTPKGDGVPA